REHRLYLVDWLWRQFRFGAGELVYDDGGNLSLAADPKQVWAVRHPEFFPVRVNSADKEALLRVPGLGPVSVERIVVARRGGRVPRLSAIGLTGKLAAKAVPYLDFT
ncbi:MAG: radical SAM protein, partial [Victivallaceae bacterium]